MIKYYCDECGKEMRKLGRLKGKYGKIEIEIMVAVNGLWNGGDACVKCIKEAARTLSEEKE